MPPEMEEELPISFHGGVAAALGESFAFCCVYSHPTPRSWAHVPYNPGHSSTWQPSSFLKTSHICSLLFYILCFFQPWFFIYGPQLAILLHAFLEAALNPVRNKAICNKLLFLSFRQQLQFSAWQSPHQPCIIPTVGFSDIQQYIYRHQNREKPRLVPKLGLHLRWLLSSPQQCLECNS